MRVFEHYCMVKACNLDQDLVLKTPNIDMAVPEIGQQHATPLRLLAWTRPIVVKVGP